MAAGLALLGRFPGEARRHVLDVSGDGRHNAGRPPGPVRDLAVQAGIVVNGLAILNEEPDLLDHYATEVIGGPGSFAMTCADYPDFADAILRKLRRELSGALVAEAGPSGGITRRDPPRQVLPMLLLIPGPVQTRPEVRAVMGDDIAPWDDEFRAEYAAMRPRIVRIAGGVEGTDVALPLPGCGHMVVEAAVRTFVPAGGKLLVVQNGNYADRLVRLATEAGRVVVPLQGPDTEPMAPEKLAAALAANPDVDACRDHRQRDRQRRHQRPRGPGRRWCARRGGG